MRLGGQTPTPDLRPGQHSTAKTADSSTISMASAISFGDANSGCQVGQSFAPITAELHLPPGRLLYQGSKLLTNALAKNDQKHHPARPQSCLSVAT
jgi:hypothetical protein